MKHYPRQRVCVICGAARGSDPRFLAAAAELGAGLAADGHEIVYGGSASGCMGALADAALAGGARVAGVRPPLMNPDEQPHSGLTELDKVADLATRKLRMFARSDIILALPGGTGTLDELLEAMTMKRFRLITHPIGVVDIGGFFGPVLDVFGHFVRTGFADAAQLGLYDVLRDVSAARRWLADQTDAY